MMNVCAKFNAPVFTRYSNTKGNVKCIKYGDLGGDGSLTFMGNVTLR